MEDGSDAPMRPLRRSRNPYAMGIIKLFSAAERSKAVIGTDHSLASTVFPMPGA